MNEKNDTSCGKESHFMEGMMLIKFAMERRMYRSVEICEWMCGWRILMATLFSFSDFSLDGWIYISDGQILVCFIKITCATDPTPIVSSSISIPWPSILILSSYECGLALACSLLKTRHRSRGNRSLREAAYLAIINE